MNPIRRTRTAIKELARDIYWLHCGRKIQNPTVPVRVENVLYVCMGNICRSAYAHHYSALKLLSFSEKIPFTVQSAGLRVKDSSSPETALVAAQRRGVGLNEHVPRQIDKKVVSEADMILSMEPGQINTILNLFPDTGHKLYLLSFFENSHHTAYSGWRKYHIEDPFGKPLIKFNQCFERIERCIDGLMEKILHMK